ncbi:MAG: hypothetical protein H6Q49_1113 [Deltaproteobacteria bacterium]|nr:hypothetical protein [Deltaproteobacteria bacterium]
MALCLLIISFADISIAQEDELDERVKNCISCCTGKQPACYNITADRRLCAAEYENCVATCKSEGKSPSEWSDCWSQSEP